MYAQETWAKWRLGVEANVRNAVVRGEVGKFDDGWTLASGTRRNSMRHAGYLVRVRFRETVQNSLRRRER
jgi:hypothetical protein